MVKVGITSNPGIISSTKDTTPAAFPILPLYSLIINQAEIGAQITSEKSPRKGTAKESIPIPSKRRLKKRFFIFLLDLVDI